MGRRWVGNVAAVFLMAATFAIAWIVYDREQDGVETDRGQGVPGSLVRIESTLRDASALASANHADRAVKVLREERNRAQVSGESFDAIKRMAGLFDELGDPETAESTYRELAAAGELSEPQQLEGRLHLARFLMARGRDAESENLYRDVLSHASDPGQTAHSLESLAILARRRGAPGEAERYYQEIETRLPWLPWAKEMSRWGLADLYEQEGKPHDALRVLSEILEVSKDPARVSWSLLKTFQISRLLRDTDTAERSYKRLQDEFPDTEPAAIARQEESPRSGRR